jgi:nucleoside-diphosphate-sugar epimerase
VSAPLEVLLIGGSGFIGRHAAAALIAAGHRVSMLTRGRRPAPEGVETLLADRGDPHGLARALESRRFDLTVDFLVYDAHDLESLLLVPYAALGRYVMISTGQVYLVSEGAAPPFREEQAEGGIVTEPERGTADHDGWSYGVAKRRAERVLLGLRGTHGMRAMALRPPILQGEADGSLRLWGYLERLLDGGPIVLPDGGAQPTRHLDVADLARALVWLADHDPPRATFYNLAQPDTVPLRELIERMARVAGVSPRFVDISWDELREAGIDETASPYAGRWSSIMDPTRAAIEWGFAATPSTEYLPRVVRWHLEHRPARSHRGYVHRARELELAGRPRVGLARG